MTIGQMIKHKVFVFVILMILFWKICHKKKTLRLLLVHWRLGNRWVAAPLSYYWGMTMKRRSLDALSLVRPVVYSALFNCFWSVTCCLVWILSFLVSFFSLGFGRHWWVDCIWLCYHLLFVEIASFILSGCIFHLWRTYMGRQLGRVVTPISRFLNKKMSCMWVSDKTILCFFFFFNLIFSYYYFIN